MTHSWGPGVKNFRRQGMLGTQQLLVGKVVFLGSLHHKLRSALRGG